MRFSFSSSSITPVSFFCLDFTLRETTFLDEDFDQISFFVFSLNVAIYVGGIKSETNYYQTTSIHKLVTLYVSTPHFANFTHYSHR